MSAIPAAASEANAKTLADALAATKLTDEPETEKTAAAAEEDLEEGEIKEGEKEDDGKPKTVFHDAAHFNIKHPLYAKWTLYFDSPATKNLPKTPQTTPASPLASTGWMEDIRKVIEFDSVEEFWGVYNNVVPPSQLPGKANYYLFKDGIMPAWEDPANKNGGKWSIQVPRDKSRAMIDKAWLYTILAAIGETFETPLTEGGVPEQSDMITGVIMSCRPGFYRIALWTREAPDLSGNPQDDPLFKRIITIGKFFKVKVLAYQEDQKLVSGGFQTEITFESHKDSERKGNKNKCVI